MDWPFIILTLKLDIAIECSYIFPENKFPEIRREQCFEEVLKCTIVRNNLEECLNGKD